MQSATAEIRRGKKIHRMKKKPKNIMACPISLGGHNETVKFGVYIAYRSVYSHSVVLNLFLNQKLKPAFGLNVKKG